MPTSPMTFQDLVDVVDVMGPLSSFVDYGGMALAAVLTIVLAYIAVRKLFYWLQHVTLYRYDHDYAADYDRDRESERVYREKMKELKKEDIPF